MDMFGDDPDIVAVKVDFDNAFNNANRAEMLRLCLQHFLSFMVTRGFVIANPPCSTYRAMTFRRWFTLNKSRSQVAHSGVFCTV